MKILIGFECVTNSSLMRRHALMTRQRNDDQTLFLVLDALCKDRDIELNSALSNACLQIKSRLCSLC